jgi:hypothetical protein
MIALLFCKKKIYENEKVISICTKLNEREGERRGEERGRSI